MELIIRLQVYMVSLSILIIIYSYSRQESQVYSLRDRLFQYLTLSVMFPLVLEGMTWMVNGYPGKAAWVLHVVLDVFLFVTNIIPLAIWTLYIILTIDPDKKGLTKEFIPIGIIVVINTVIALSTPYTKKYFYIDANNIYHRGEWNMVSSGIVGLLFIYDFWLILINRKKINQRDRVPMLLFLLPPLIAFIFQMLFFGTSLIWPACAISVLIVFTMIQSQTIKTDYLTGLYNRRQLDFYLSRRIENLWGKQKFAGIMIDMDDFKVLNDQFGHVVGDEALRSASALISKAFHKDAFIARYGGDEFTILVNIKDEKDLQDQIDKLKRQFKLFNDRKKEVYQLEISIGYSIYTAEYKKASTFLDYLDQLMYKNKEKRKSQVFKRQYPEGKVI